MTDTEEIPGMLGILDTLDAALRLNSSSLFTYLLEVSDPFTSPQDQAIGEALRKLAEDERSDRAEIFTLMDEMGGSPSIDTFDMEVAHYNYLSVSYLIGLVTNRLRDQIAEFEKLAARVAGEPRASVLLREIAAKRTKSLEAVQAAIAAKQKAAAAAAAKAAPPAAKPAPAAAAKPAAPAASAAAKPTAAATPAAPATPAAASAAPASPAATPPAPKTIDPEKLAAAKALAEKKKAAMAAAAAGSAAPPATPPAPAATPAAPAVPPAAEKP